MDRIEITEFEQRSLFLQNVVDDGASYYVEVPVFSRSVDLVKYNVNNQEITAVEFKIKDWKKAIQQVLAISIAFDYIEICIIKPKTYKCIDNIVNECKLYGIGVYFCEINDGQLFVEKYMEPVLLNKTWQLQKVNILNYINGGRI